MLPLKINELHKMVHFIMHLREKQAADILLANPLHQHLYEMLPAIVRTHSRSGWGFMQACGWLNVHLVLGLKLNWKSML